MNTAPEAIKKVISQLSLEQSHFLAKDGQKNSFSSYSPIDQSLIASVKITSPQEYETILKNSVEVFHKFRQVPAPKRGELVRLIAEELRKHKDLLGTLVTLECGKIKAEGDGEIQEAIDIADFAVGLSRQLYGLTMHSERPGHRMYEQWHPLGVIGVITAFNFPAAVWAWNAMLACVCGNVTLWKPSEKTPVTAIAMVTIAEKVAANFGFPGLFPLVFDNDASIGKLMCNDKRLPLISATGSTRMGRAVGEAVAKRLGRSLLELGGNNAMIITPEADLNLAIPAILFGAVGTAGQRCTTTRRLIVHSSIVDAVIEKLKNSYGQVKIGDPLDPKTLMGPLIDESAYEGYKKAIEQAKKEGGQLVFGGNRFKMDSNGYYVEPAIIKVNKDCLIAKEETFAPILYVMPYSNLDEALDIHNGVDHGLSSAIFTNNLREAEQFLSASGSDCGIANVNIGTSGAEIGGAFGGEKDTGGGRESGSDSWKIYMRRQTNTINYSTELPLAQGIRFSS